MDYTRPNKRVKLGDLTVPPKPNSKPMNWLFNAIMYVNNPGALYTFISLLPKHELTKELSEIAGALYTAHMFLKAVYGSCFPLIDKPIIESYTYQPTFYDKMINYVSKYLGIPTEDTTMEIDEDHFEIFSSNDAYKVLWLFPGDGHLPHGSFVQALHGGTVIMIDPIYNEEKFQQIMEKNKLTHCIPNNLQCVKDTCENFLKTYIPENGTNLIVTVSIHSHANSNIIWDLVERYKLPQILVTLPCCKESLHFPSKGIKCYDSYDQTNAQFRLGNPGILSPCNRIHIFRNELIPDTYKNHILCKRF